MEFSMQEYQSVGSSIFSRGPSPPRDGTWVLHCRQILYCLSHLGSPGKVSEQSQGTCVLDISVPKTHTVRPWTTYSFDVQLDLFICKNDSIGLYVLYFSSNSLWAHTFLTIQSSGRWWFSCSVMSDSVAPWIIAHRIPFVCGISQARVLEGVAISFSWGSSWPRDWTWVSCFVGGLLHCRQTLYQLSHQGSLDYAVIWAYIWKAFGGLLCANESLQDEGQENCSSSEI